MKVNLLIKPLFFIVILVFILSFFEFLTAGSRTYSRLMMHEMYHQEEPVDIFFVGASTIHRGLNPAIFDKRLNKTTFNLGTASQNVVGTYYLLKEAYKYHNPEIVLIDINVERLGPIKSNPRTNEVIFDYYPFSVDKLWFLKDAFEIDHYHKALLPATRDKNRGVLSDFAAIQTNIEEKLTPEYQNYSYSIARHDNEWYQGKGYIQTEKTFPEIGIKSGWIEFKAEDVDSQAIQFYEKVLQLCKEHNSIPILITMPRIEFTHEDQGISDFSDYANWLAVKNDVEYYDFNLLRKSVFEKKERYFYDRIHMNQRGAEKFSQVLSDFLSDYMAWRLDEDDYFI